MNGAPDAILIGHSGSTSAHPAIVGLSTAIKAAIPGAWIVYGGTYPTYHAAEILTENPQFNVIVRGEGERTTAVLISALESGRPLAEVPGIAFRSENGVPHVTKPAPGNQRP